MYGRKLYKINQNAIQTVIGVEEYAHEENKSLLIYPNPVTCNEIYLDLTSDALLKKVVIYNMLGEEIFPTTIQIEGNRIRLELPELKAGIYQTQVYTDKGMFSGKFVK